MPSRVVKKRGRIPAAAGRNSPSPAAVDAPAQGASQALSKPVSSGWIISPFWDATLFIGAPLVSIAALFPLKAFWNSHDYAVFLLAFLTTGHHLPGFIRVYGDRELFQHYRWRFLLGPPLIFAAALWFEWRSLHGILMLSFGWDVWHVLMQHYGFMRIYDAKQKEFSPLTARLDWAFSLSLYVALIVASPHYRNNLLYLAYQSGFPVLPISLFSFLETAIYSVTAIAAMVYLGYNFFLWKKGRLNSKKLATLAFFFGATYYLYIYNQDFVVGFAVWSGFHCLQYYGIVWAFNRTRVERGGHVTRFVRFLFRPKVGLAALYVLLIFAYGGFDYLVNFVGQSGLKTVMVAFVTTSALLHYYFDGFIWKVREKENREPLGIEEEKPAGLIPASAKTLAKWGRRLLPSYRKGLYQAGYVTAFILLVGSLEIFRPNDDLSMNRSLAMIAPGAEVAHLRLGESLRLRGRAAEAAVAYQRAVDLNPAYADAHVMFGLTMVGLGNIDEAVKAYRQALEIQPGNVTAHFNLAGLLEERSQIEEAIQHYQQATLGADQQVEQLAREAMLRLQSKR